MKKTIDLSKTNDSYINGWHKNNAFGDCHILSTVLSEVSKSPVGVVFDKSTDLPVHSFVVLETGLALDANGINSIDDVINVYKSASDNAGFSRDFYFEEFDYKKGIKFLNLWSNVDVDYYESALEEFKMVLDHLSDFKDCLADNFFDLENLYSFEYYNENLDDIESPLNFLEEKQSKSSKKRLKNRPF